MLPPNSINKILVTSEIFENLPFAQGKAKTEEAKILTIIKKVFKGEKQIKNKHPISFNNKISNNELPSDSSKLTFLTRFIYITLLKMAPRDVMLLYDTKIKLQQLKKKMRCVAKLAKKESEKANKLILSNKTLANDRRIELKEKLKEERREVMRLNQELDNKIQEVERLAVNYPDKVCAQLLANYKKMEKAVNGFRLNLKIHRSLVRMEKEVKEYGFLSASLSISSLSSNFYQMVENYDRRLERIKQKVIEFIETQLASSENDHLKKILDQMGLTTNPQRGAFEAAIFDKSKLSEANLGPLLKKIFPSLAPFYIGLNQTMRFWKKRRFLLLQKELREAALLQKKYKDINLDELCASDRKKLEEKVHRWATDQYNQEKLVEWIESYLKTNKSKITIGELQLQIEELIKFKKSVLELPLKQLEELYSKRENAKES